MAARPAGVTHQVIIDAGQSVVTKRYRSWRRGEPAREWRALRLLAEFAPGLAARPISATLDAEPPFIQMSWLPGEQLGGTPLTVAQTHALAGALDRLWAAVPAERLRRRGPAAAGPAGTGHAATNAAALACQVRQALAAWPDPGDDALVRTARAAAAAWLNRAALPAQGPAGSGVVLGQGDSNLANFLWDGDRVRLVDFEDSGPSDRAFELAILVEHISAWADGGMDTDAFAGLFGLSAAERARLREFRRLAALFWLTLLRPGGRASRRNPPGAARRQADRLLALLG